MEINRPQTLAKEKTHALRAQRYFRWIPIYHRIFQLVCAKGLSKSLCVCLFVIVWIRTTLVSWSSSLFSSHLLSFSSGANQKLQLQSAMRKCDFVSLKERTVIITIYAFDCVRVAMIPWFGVCECVYEKWFLCRDCRAPKHILVLPIYCIQKFVTIKLWLCGQGTRWWSGLLFVREPRGAPASSHYFGIWYFRIKSVTFGGARPWSKQVLVIQYDTSHFS